MENFVFNGLGCNVMARPQNDQILEPPDNLPIPFFIDFALVASVEPSIAQHFCRLLRPIPVSRENIWPADDDLCVFRELHFYAGDRGASTSRNDGRIRIVHGADSRRLRQSVYLQYGNTEHHKK